MEENITPESQERSEINAPEAITEPPKKTSKKWLVIVVVIVIILISGIGGFFIYQSQKQAREQLIADQEAVTPPSRSIFPTKLTPAHSLVAYSSDRGDGAGSNYVQIFDLTTFSLKPVVELLNMESVSYNVGKWSPNGRYLAFRATDSFSLDGEEKERTQYFILYDSTDNTARIIDSQILHRQEDFVKDSFYTSGSLSNYWLNNDIYGYDEHGPDESDFHYYSLDGSFKTQERDSLEAVSRISEFYKFTDEGYVLENLQVDGEQVIPVPVGDAVGFLNNQLVTFEMPLGLSIGVDDGGNMASEEDFALFEQTLKELEEAGATEEELMEQMLLMVAPREDHLIHLTDISSGEVTQTISLPADVWYTNSVQVHPTKPVLIARQGNEAMLASKERYILIDPNKPDNLEVLLEQDVTVIATGAMGHMYLIGGHEFYLSTDGKWLVGVKSQTADSKSPLDPLNVFALDLNSLEVQLVCEDCDYPRLLAEPQALYDSSAAQWKTENEKGNPE